MNRTSDVTGSGSRTTPRSGGEPRSHAAARLRQAAFCPPRRGRFISIRTGPGTTPQPERYSRVGSRQRPAKGKGDKVKTVSDKTMIWTVVGTGLGMTALLVTVMTIQNGGVNSRIDDLNRRINDQNTRFTDVNTRIGDLGTNINNRFDDVNNRFDDLNGRLEDVNGRLDDVNGRLDDLNDRATGTENEMREVRQLLFERLKGDPPVDQ